uniref:Uncharacterized protein n=1 Tax=Setaria italica TaxID=4555 RepID=K3YBA2_SETIT
MTFGYPWIIVFNTVQSRAHSHHIAANTVSLCPLTIHIAAVLLKFFSLRLLHQCAGFGERVVVGLWQVFDFSKVNGSQLGMHQ